MLHIRVPLRNSPDPEPINIPTPQTQIEGSYAYNEFQFKKRELYMYDIFDMQKQTKKWLK